MRVSSFAAPQHGQYPFQVKAMDDVTPRGQGMGADAVLARRRSLLLIVDIQERLAPATLDPATVSANAGVLVSAAQALDVPVRASEQYAKGLGLTVPTLRARLAADAVFDKMHFSAAAEPGVVEALRGTGRDQVVLVGMEAHVCVLQSALGLRAAGFAVAVVADAISARRAENKALALDRARAAGITVVSTEMVLFEWMQTAAIPAFRSLIALIK